jgi:DNA repair protein RadA/Sms
MAFGEVGLNGEIRPIANGQERIKEATKHGFDKLIVPKANLPKSHNTDAKIIGVSTLLEAIDAI